MAGTFAAFLDWWFSSPFAMNLVAAVAALMLLVVALLELTSGGADRGTF